MLVNVAPCANRCATKISADATTTNESIESAGNRTQSHLTRFADAADGRHQFAATFRIVGRLGERTFVFKQSTNVP
jgi:hypothetical protein